MFEHRGLNYDNWGKSIQTVYTYRQGEKLSVKIILGVVAVSVKIFRPWNIVIIGDVYSRMGPLTHFILETPKGVLAKSADPDQMPHNVASDLGLHYFASCSTIFQQKYLN